MTAPLPPAEWNQTDRTYPSDLLHEVFAARALADPAAPALRFGDETLTYGDLDGRVSALCHRLNALGVRQGSLVAVCMERSIEMVVSLHAILRAGGAYVPIDPEYPDERIAFMLDDLDQPILLTQQRLLHRLESFPATAVAVDADAPTPPEVPAALPKAGPDDLAYVIYTSGSTGQPKGAKVSHRAIANRIYWMQEYFELAADDKVLQKTPFSFDVSVWEFFWPLLFGAELVVAKPGGHRDNAYLVRTIIEHGITTIHFVPSMLQLFLEEPRASECASLRRVICSGEALSRALQDRFFTRLEAELHNLYGPTEAAVDVTAWMCDSASELSFVPIGKPVANTQLHILDLELRPVPVGAAGELHIGGVQVGQGYVNRPELTSERFIADPFREGGTLYKSGDLARYLPDGNIEFLGRADYQVKIRGFRVELGEIEANLEACDGVRGSIVIAHANPDGETELVAYVASPDGDVHTSDLRRNLAQRLPGYMVPSRFIVLSRFPLSSNGKIDRKALPPPGRTRPGLDTPYTPPRSDLEQAVAGKWRQLLDIDRIGVNDRFFELGGTSLQAARFVNQMQSDLGTSLSVTTLFAAPSVAEYADLLEREHAESVAVMLGRELTPQASATGSVGDGYETATVVDMAVSASSDRRSEAHGRRSGLAAQRSRRRTARAGD